MISPVHSREALWQRLEQALDTVSKQETSSLSYQDLYKSAYDLVQCKQGDYLYRHI